MESLLAVLGALAGVAVTVLVWASISSYQPMWPLPGLYLLEIVALGVAAAVFFVLGKPGGKILTWAAVGMLAAFCILGALSVGFFYLPGTVLIGIAALIHDLRLRDTIVAHLGVCLLGGLAQAALMLALIYLR